MDYFETMMWSDINQAHKLNYHTDSLTGEIQSINKLQHFKRTDNRKKGDSSFVNRKGIKRDGRELQRMKKELRCVMYPPDHAKLPILLSWWKLSCPSLQPPGAELARVHVGPLLPQPSGTVSPASNCPSQFYKVFVFPEQSRNPSCGWANSSLTS